MSEAALQIVRGAEAASPDGEDSHPRSTWRPMDLTEVLSGSLVRLEPTLGLRSDGQPLLYAGKVHSVAGESDAGKSWVAQIWSANELKAGRDVLYLDFEDDAHSVVARLRDLGVDDDTLLRHFFYVHAEAAFPGAAAALIADCPTLSLVIIDGVTELMGMFGLNPMSDIDVAEMLRLPRELAGSGAAVVLLDHVVKERMSRGRYATGSQHKLSGIDGAAYTLEIHEPFGVGKSGGSTLLVVKDRPGAVRGLGVKVRTGYAVATLNVAESDGQMAFALNPYNKKADVDWTPTDRMQSISGVLEDEPAGMTFNELKSMVRGRDDATRDALRCLRRDGYIRETPGPNRSKRYTSLRHYRVPT